MLDLEGYALYLPASLRWRAGGWKFFDCRRMVRGAPPPLELWFDRDTKGCTGPFTGGFSCLLACSSDFTALIFSPRSEPNNKSD